MEYLIKRDIFVLGSPQATATHEFWFGTIWVSDVVQKASSGEEDLIDSNFGNEHPPFDQTEINIPRVVNFDI